MNTTTLAIWITAAAILSPAQHGCGGFAQCQELAHGLSSSGKYPEAEQIFRNNVRAAKSAGQPLVEAQALSDLARMLQELGRLSEAESLYREALLLRETHHGRNADIAITVGLLATVRFQIGDLSESETLLRRAIVIAQEALGPDSAELGNLYLHLSITMSERGEAARAEPLARRGLAILSKTLGPEHVATATMRQNMAHIYLRQGQCGQAELLIRESLPVLEAALGPKHPDVSRIRGTLLGALVCGRRYDKANALAGPTLEALEESLGAHHVHLIPVLLYTAHIHRIAGDYVAATGALERAVQLVRENDATSQANAAYLLSECAELLKKRKAAPGAKRLEAAVKSVWGSGWRRAVGKHWQITKHQ